MPSSSAPCSARRLPCAPTAGLLLLAALALWHAPLTLLARMPAGGDVVGFFLPLMSSFQDALRSGHSLLWNHAWGFGFPQAAESQTGVYYPVRRILLWLLPLPTAFVTELLMHMALAAGGAYAFARRVELPPRSAALAALVFAGSGFMVIHTAHQWAYTAGAWLPIVLALALRCLDSPEAGAPPAARTRRLHYPALAVAVAFQLTTGHYQIAAYTLVTLVVLVLLRYVRCRSRSPALLVSTGLALALGIGLAAVQWLQSAALLRQASLGGHGLKYAGEFALPPLQLLVNLVLPSAFHVIPAWRPVVWDPFHTSPEEVLPFFGVVPLVLAIVALTGRDGEARRVGALLALLGLLLASLPFLPGARLILDLRGLDAFRAHARWTIVASLGVGVLAGVGLERLLAQPERLRRRPLRRPSLAAAGLTLASSLVVVALAGGLGGTVERQARRLVHATAARLGVWELPAFDAALEGSPYPSPALERLGYAARALGLATQRRLQTAGRSIDAALVLGLEVIPAAAVALASLITLYTLAPTRMLTIVAAGCTFFELWFAHLLVPVPYVERADYRRASVVLERLAERAASALPARVLGLPGNTALLAGAAPVPGYRTLELPVRLPGPLDPWAALEQPLVRKLHAVAGIERYVLVVPRGATQELIRRLEQANVRYELYDDPALSTLLYGDASSAGGRPLFFVLHGPGRARAWYYEATSPVRAGWFLNRAGRPLEVRVGGGGLEVSFRVEGDRGGIVLWTVPYYRAWRAEAEGERGPPKPLKLARSPEGWVLLRLPGPGRWLVKLRYEDAAYRWGLRISGLSALVLLVGLCGWSAAAMARGVRRRLQS